MRNHVRYGRSQGQTMNRTASFSLGPLSLRMRDDDTVTIDLPRLHAEMTSIAYAVDASERFRDELAQMVAGARDTAHLSLDYGDPVAVQDVTAFTPSVSYGLRLSLVRQDEGWFKVVVEMQPDLADDIHYIIDFPAGPKEVESAEVSFGAE